MIDSAPLDAATLEALKAEIAKPRVSADSLRKRLDPYVSGATFWRALHGGKVTLRVRESCDAMARALRERSSSALKPGCVYTPDGRAMSELMK